MSKVVARSRHVMRPQILSVLMLMAGCAAPPAVNPSDEPPPLAATRGVSLVSSAPRAQGLRLSSQPADDELMRLGLFALPLVPVGPSRAQDNRALADALVRYDAALTRGAARDELEPLLEFQAAHPRSPWNAALQVNLGAIYRQTGHFSRALASWNAAWQATREADDLHARAVADASVAQLSQLLAFLGRKQALASLLNEIRARPLRGTAAELVSESARGLSDMQRLPESSFKCGPFALTRILQYTEPVPPTAALAILSAARSTPQGLSLADVHALALRAGMHYQMVFRSAGAPLMLPAVAHWKVGHYAAIVAEEADRYRVQDSTFGEDIRMGHATLDDEASGYMLVPRGTLLAGYRNVSVAEAARVWGRGDTGNNKDNGATGPADTQSSNVTCGGCTTWSVEPMVVSLALHDVPVGYTPPVGPAVQFDVYYSQRDVQQPQLFNYGNLGRKWTSSWLSYVTDNRDLNGTIELYRRGGGNETFTFASGASASNPGPFSQTIVTRVVDASGGASGFVRQFSDGSSEEFAQAFGTKYFMTALSDMHGNALQLAYDAQMRLVTLTDALGQVTRIDYTDADPLKITHVTDPFGRAAAFAYNADGNLESVTDTLGIVSRYSYGGADFISALETPYGTTRFAYGDATTDATLGNTRFLNVTDALGRSTRVEFHQSAPGVSSADTVVPRGMNVKNDLLQWRNTFIWSPTQYAAAQTADGLDYGKARALHWLHTLDNSTSRVLESVKEPLENRVWYDYPGQTQPVYVGTSDQPQHVGRVLDDGSTQLLAYEYNARGKLTKSIDPTGRTLLRVYADDGIDLLSVTNVTGGLNDTLVSIAYDDKHSPSRVTAANGGTTNYEYNAQGQLTKVRDALGGQTALSYDARANLVAIDGPAGARVAFTRDDVGRIASSSDAAGIQVSYAYDAADRRIQTMYADGTSLQFAYQLLDLASVTDSSGNHTDFTFDAERELTQVSDALRQQAQLVYTADGQLGAITDAAGHTTSVTYDVQGRAVSKQFADGTVQHFAYESGSSRLHSVVDALGQMIGYEYTVDDNLAALVGPPPTAAIKFSYDQAYRRLSAMQDAIGTTTFGYFPIAGATAGAGNLASVTSPVPGTTGQLDSLSYSYDLLDRVIGQAVNGVNEAVGYDALSRVISVDNALDKFALGFSDATARASTLSSSHGPKIALSYFDAVRDGLLQQIGVTRQDGRGLARFGYVYDTSENLTSFSEDYEEVSSAQADMPTHSALPVPRKSTPDGGRPGLRAMAADWWLGAAAVLLLGLLTLRRRVTPALLPLLLPLLAASFCTDAQHINPALPARATAYTYDLTNRLISAAVKSGPELPVAPQFQYEYDGASNLVRMADPSGSQSHTHTASNALQPGHYDANGNPQELDGVQYGWDANDQVVQVVQNDRQSEFSYDGLRRLVRIVEKQAGKVTADHAYFWCGDTRCLEHDNLRTGSPVSKQYFDQGFIAAGQSYYYVRDQLGSVRQLVDASGRIRAQYDYDPYGRVSRQRGDIDSDARYAGYFQHAQTGLTFARYRAYDATQGRWLNRDPLGEEAGLNLYAYVNGSPANLSDPSGLYTGVDDAVFAAGGAVVGVVGQGIGDAFSGQLSSWQDYTGSAVGGAAGGVALLYTGPVGAGAVGGAVSNGVKQGLKMATGEQCNFSVGSLAVDTAIGAATGFIPGSKVAGATTGRNSYNAIFKQMTTKLKSGAISNVSVKTAGKMLVGRAVDTALLPGAGAGVAGGFGATWIEHLLGVKL
jgi:RHS repeat-associated protein